MRGAHGRSLSLRTRVVVLAAVFLALPVGAYLLSTALRWLTYSSLAWISLLPIFLAIRILGPGAALTAGAVWGFSLFSFSSSPGGPVERSNACAVLLIVVPAAYAFLGSLVSRRFGFSPLVLGCGWIGVELLLTPLGLERGLIGVAGDEGGGLAAVSRFAGYIVAAFLVATVNAGLIVVVSEARVIRLGSVVWLLSGTPRRLMWQRTVVFIHLHVAGPARPRSPPVGAGTLKLQAV